MFGRTKEPQEQDERLPQQQQQSSSSSSPSTDGGVVVVDPQSAAAAVVRSSLSSKNPTRTTTDAMMKAGGTADVPYAADDNDNCGNSSNTTDEAAAAAAGSSSSSSPPLPTGNEEDDTKGTTAAASHQPPPPPPSPRRSVDPPKKNKMNADEASSRSTTSYLHDLCKRAIRYDEESFIYSIRIAISMFVAALFTLINPGNFVFPQTPWILASTAVVGWQNTLDTATAVKRAIERTVGTFIGAVLGLVVGFISLPLQYSKPGQATLLGFTTIAFCFFMPYFTANVGLRGSYAARLCLVSYAIISLSFYTSNEPCHPSGWYMGVWRAIDIMLGCFIGAASLVIHPRSMKAMIVKRVKSQIKTVGESTFQVLDTACQSFTADRDGARTMAHWDDMLTAGGGTDVAQFETDPAYVAYIKGAHGWKDCNELFGMLKYDHTLLSMTKDEKAEFQRYMTIISHRVFRMHTNLVVLASIVRGASASIARELGRTNSTSTNSEEKAVTTSMDAAFAALRDIGQRIKVLLDSSQIREDRDNAFTTLVTSDLIVVGRLVSQEQEESVKVRHERAQTENNGQGMDETLEQLQGMLLSRFDATSRQHSPLEHIESHQQVSLFFLLVEHLIIRATCLYQLLKPELYDAA